MVSHSSLKLYYQELHTLTHHNYTMTEIESMIPFEKEIYTNLIMKDLEERRKKLEKNN